MSRHVEFLLYDAEDKPDVQAALAEIRRCERKLDSLRDDTTKAGRKKWERLFAKHNAILDDLLAPYDVDSDLDPYEAVSLAVFNAYNAVNIDDLLRDIQHERDARRWTRKKQPRIVTQKAREVGLDNG